jgi:outer membrane protein assembly factor BamB
LPSRRRTAAGVAILLVLAAGALGVFVVYVRSGRDVIGSPTVEFLPKDLPARPEQVAATPWPTWGLDSARNRWFPAGPPPPYRVVWRFAGRSLLEFPPALAYGRVFLPTFAGLVVALDADSGKVLWRHVSGRCAWASPAVANGLVYQTFLLRPPTCDPGRGRAGMLVALDAASGRVRWRVALAPTESSPLVSNGLVYVGDWSGRVTAFDARTGARRWSVATGGAVKGSVALAGRRAYVGAYDGRLYGLDARTGRVLWHTSSPSRLGRRGAFYSTPAIAYGRIYLGSTDGSVYSFGAVSGKLRWSHRTGGYVYGSPAVWRGRILVGSYDGRFNALDAATGRVRWSFDAGAPISGSASVLGRIVYFSTLGERTFGLDAATGRELWRFPDGKYSPMVTDGRRLYVTGYSHLYALLPR